MSFPTVDRNRLRMITGRFTFVTPRASRRAICVKVLSARLLGTGQRTRMARGIFRSNDAYRDRLFRVFKLKCVGGAVNGLNCLYQVVFHRGDRPNERSCDRTNAINCVVSDASFVFRYVKYPIFLAPCPADSIVHRDTAPRGINAHNVIIQLLFRPMDFFGSDYRNTFAGPITSFRVQYVHRVALRSIDRRINGAADHLVDQGNMNRFEVRSKGCKARVLKNARSRFLRYLYLNGCHVTQAFTSNDQSDRRRNCFRHFLRLNAASGRVPGIAVVRNSNDGNLYHVCSQAASREGRRVRLLAATGLGAFMCLPIGKVKLSASRFTVDRANFLRKLLRPVRRAAPCGEATSVCCRRFLYAVLAHRYASLRFDVLTGSGLYEAVGGGVVRYVPCLVCQLCLSGGHPGTPRFVDPFSGAGVPDGTRRVPDVASVEW